MPKKIGGGGGGKDAGKIEVSRLTETHILEVLKTRDTFDDEGKGLESTSVKKVGKVWDDLCELGFSEEDAGLAIRCTPAISTENCLDWLCLNIEEMRLPAKFRSSYRPTEMQEGKVTVVAPPKRKEHSKEECGEAGASEKRTEEEAQRAHEAEQELRAAKEKAEEERLQREQKEALREAAERKAWILKMAAGAGEGSEESEDEGSGAEEASEEEEEEDLADKVNTAEALVEVHRMKAERAKKDDVLSLDRLLTLVQEGRVVTASVEELHVKLQQAAQGMSASRGSRNSKQGNLREAQARKDLIRTSKLISQARGNVKSLQHAIALIQEKENNKEQEPEDLLASFALLELDKERDTEASPHSHTQERGRATVGIACKLSEVSNMAEGDVLSARGTDGESGGKRGGARGGGGGRGDSQASGGSGRRGWKGSKGEEEGAGVDEGTDGEMDKDSQAATQVGRAAGVVVSVSEALRGWTGKTPKKMLEELLQKEKKAKPKFGVLSVNPARCDVTVGKDVYQGPVEVVCAKVAEAEQVAATVALFKLCRGRQLYRMMPSLFRDLWLEWEKQELDGKSNADREKEARREAMLASLIDARSVDEKSRKAAAVVGGGSGGSETRLQTAAAAAAAAGLSSGTTLQGTSDKCLGPSAVDGRPLVGGGKPRTRQPPPRPPQRAAPTRPGREGGGERKEGENNHPDRFESCRVNAEGDKRGVQQKERREEKQDGEERRGGREVCESWECDDEEEALKEEAAVGVKESWDSDDGGGISDDMLNQPKPSNSQSPEEGGGETRAEEDGGGRKGKEEEEGERKGAVAYEGGRGSKQTRIMEESVKMKAAWECVKRTGAWQAVWEQRKTLPIHKEAEAILAAIDTCPCVVLVGETGCGKSTQVAQMILDAALQRGEAADCHIICTQPRRVAAMGLAERVAAERCESLGEPGAVTGYQIRMESSKTSSTRILFCTTGILLRMLQEGGQDEDGGLAGVSHVIVDEAHERDVLSDFLLIILRDLVRRQRHLRVVIMSATMEAQRFADYLALTVDSSHTQSAPIIQVPGRTFPVVDYYLEDILEATGHVISEGHPCALRRSAAYAGSQKMHISSKGGNSATVTASWDEHDLDGVGTTNDLYDEALYSSFSKTTKLSLRRVDHEKINYELVLDLLKLIDAGLCSGRLNRRQPPEGGGGGGGGEREGAVLVFLPGLGEIMQLHDMLMASSVYSNRNKWMIVAAHSSLSAEEQRRIFKRPPPGVRKVVLATNIAETSITIDDVVFVIDTGRVKQSRYHQSHKIRTLVECWVDKASARQRAGRAGRVCAGHCFHLYTRVLATQVFDEHSSPEMRRVPLEELCLQILAMGHIDVMSFLSKALDAPSPSAVSAALSTLSDVSAIDERGRLTALGQHLAKLPVDPHIGKLLVLGAIFECIDPILTIAACCSYKSPLASSIDRRADMAEARKRLGGPSPESDLLLSVNAYNQWAAACHEGGGRGGETVCRDHCLNAAVLVQLRDLRRQFADLLKNIGFLARRGEGNRSRNSRPLANCSLFDQESNANGGSTAVVCGVVCAGLYPNIVKVEQWRGNDMVLRGQAAEGRDLILHKSSALYNRNDAVPLGALIVYHQKMATSRSYVMDATLVHANAVVLFGRKLVVDHVNAGVTLDGWLHLHVPARTAVMIKELRNELDALLRNKVQHPQMDLKKEGGGLVKAVLLLLQENAPKNN